MQVNSSSTTISDDSLYHIALNFDQKTAYSGVLVSKQWNRIVLAAQTIVLHNNEINDQMIRCAILTTKINKETNFQFLENIDKIYKLKFEPLTSFSAKELIINNFKNKFLTCICDHFSPKDLENLEPNAIPKFFDNSFFNWALVDPDDKREPQNQIHELVTAIKEIDNPTEKFLYERFSICNKLKFYGNLNKIQNIIKDKNHIFFQEAVFVFCTYLIDKKVGLIKLDSQLVQPNDETFDDIMGIKDAIKFLNNLEVTISLHHELEDYDYDGSYSTQNKLVEIMIKKYGEKMYSRLYSIQQKDPMLRQKYHKEEN